MEELVFGFTRPRNLHGANRPGITSESGFTSFNGLVPTQAASKEDFMDQLYLIGVGRTNYNPFDKQQPRNGIAVTRTLGPMRVAYDMVPTSAYPGDLMVWTIPGYPGDDFLMAGGQFGLSTNRPRSKLIGYLEPYDPSYVGDYFAILFETMMSREDGVHDFPPGATGKHLPTRYQAALALRQFSLLAPLRVIDTLQNRGLLTINTPYEKHRQELINTFLNDGSTPEGFDNSRTGLNQAIASLLPTDPTHDLNTSYMRGGVGGNGPQAEDAITTRERTYFVGDMHREDTLSRDEKKALRIQEQKNVLFLGQLLGAIGSEGKSSLAVRDDVLMSIYAEYAGDSGYEEYFPNMQDVAQQSGSPLAVEYVVGTMEAARHLSTAITEAKHSYERRIGARAISYATGGGEMNETVNVYLTQ